MMGLVSFKEEEERPKLFLSFPSENTARRRRLSTSQGKRPHRELNLLAP